MEVGFPFCESEVVHHVDDLVREGEGEGEGIRKKS